MRSVELGYVHPLYASCAERVIFKSNVTDGRETLCIYSRDRPVVSLGRFSSKDEVIGGVETIRRMSGGSPIYSDQWQMTYSLVIGKERLPRDRNDSFRTVCGGLVNALSDLGIRSYHKPVNDVLVNNRKISGSAQYRSGNTVMQHGSLILRLDDSVDRYLIPKKRCYDGLTSIEDVLGHIPERRRIAEALMKGFSETLKLDITESELEPEEIQDIERTFYGLMPSYP